MLKHVLMASAMMISVPALAQETPVQETPAPAEQTAPETTAPVAQDSVATPADPAQDATQQAETSPMQPTPTEPVPAQAADATAPMDAGQEEPTEAADAAAAPQGEVATGADQVASVVDAEFPTYDKDSDGELKTEEFGQWMIALRSASDPSTNAESAEVKTWVDQAFASADADKSESVSKSELTGFLSQGAS